MEQQEESYEEKAKEAQEAPGEGAGWQNEADGEQSETEPADK